ncbi:MAG: RHS repeat-associated core domain-containing protein, partial [Burkholderiales bacterium]
GVRELAFNLRLPGQYFDGETGLFYNYFRDYDPQTGRYVQSDPIGLASGINPYLYVGGNPLSFSDAFGLVKWTGTMTGGQFLSAGAYYFDLRSECVNGQQAFARGVVVGPGLGVGVQVSGTTGNVAFSDDRPVPNPGVFDGFAFIAQAAIAIPHRHYNRRGIGVGVSYMKLGEASSSPSLEVVRGFDFSVGALVGSSTVLERGVLTCVCWP